MSITKLSLNELNISRQGLGWLGAFLFSFTANAVAGQVNLAWEPSSGPVAGYRVYYGNTSRTVNNNTYAYNQSAGNATTTTLSLADGKTYYFSVKAYDSAGTESDFSNEVTQTLTAAAPSAGFSADKTSGTAPVTINFTDNSTGNITSRSWNFGDGTTSTAQNPSKTYSSAGIYTVKLTATGPGGSATSTKTISVNAPTVAAPVSNFAATPTSGTAPLLVTLTDTSTGTVSSRSWDLGDGTTSSAQSVAKTYNSAGTYTVKLTVTNAGGSSTTTKTISATATTPAANFTASSSTGVAPLTTAFTNTSTGTILSYAWNFGDPNSQSNTSTAQNPSHTYLNSGTYTVTLTATGPSGTTPSTKNQTITVKSATTAASNGLVAAYNFEESAGETVIDASGRGNHGVLRGTIRVATGKFGKAASFDGIDDWITVNDSATLDLTTGMTLEAWVYPTETMSGWRSIITKEQPNGFGAAYYLAANSDVNQPEAAIYTAQWNKLYGGPLVGANQWTHLAGTYDGSTLKLYVNGTQVSSQPRTGGIDVTTGVLRIGGNDYWGEFFKGYIDEVRVYNRALNASEIVKDMSTSITSSSPAKLLLGEKTLGTTPYSIAKGTAVAFQTNAANTGMVSYLAIYVDQSSSATRLMAGIYADNNGHPGQLLKNFNSVGLPKLGAWNAIRLPAFEITAGQKYWIALLNPDGPLNIRTNASAGSQPSETGRVSAITSLPNLWTTGTISTNGSFSGYGAGY
ncbi:MAG: PKD domain-containing protein [Candidatus Competibacteraceae bacterium]|nr:PKD domain-containing protein [Candidatus Competibacteraceae bacterium]